MRYVLQTNVPRCPECSSLLFIRATASCDTYFCCSNCSCILKVVGMNQSDNEVVVSDREPD